MINPIHSNNSGKVNPSSPNHADNLTEAPPKPKNPAFDNVVDQTKAKSQGQKTNNGEINPSDVGKHQSGINPASLPQTKELPENPKVNPNPTPVKPAASTNGSNGASLNKLV